MVNINKANLSLLAIFFFNSCTEPMVESNHGNLIKESPIDSPSFRKAKPNSENKQNYEKKYELNSSLLIRARALNNFPDYPSTDPLNE